MPNLSQTLVKIAGERRADPLAPVTVIVPSHLAGIQMRRRLGELGAFAGVRFETLPRLAELVAAGSLAAAGRSPLARPIGDYLASQVALESRTELEGVRELPGYGRVLRQLFRRLRRAGIASSEGVKVPMTNGYLGELVRLFGQFRRRTEQFYDEEDLMDTAAGLISSGRAPVAELGTVYVGQPSGLSAGAQSMLAALRRRATRYAVIDEAAPRARETFVLPPDPATEAREAVRQVLRWLDEGAAMHEVAVWHGADPAYRQLLRDAFEAAGVPASVMPGVPLSETITGRAVLALAGLPAEDYSRTAVMDFMALAPLRARIPASGGDPVRPQPSNWDRLSREAGITKRAEHWRARFAAMANDLRARADDQGLDADDYRRRAIDRDLAEIEGLRGVVEALINRLEPLRASQPAHQFIERFKAVVEEYLAPDAPARAEVVAEIDQLGTIDKVGGQFTLGGFLHSLRANLEVGFVRERGLGEGVLVAGYELAAGLEFEHAVLCGAFEGAFPAGPGADTLVDDLEWARLRENYSLIEDAALRLERAEAAARRAIASARSSLVWSAPLYEAGGTREYYPSALMGEAARRADPALGSARRLRAAPAGGLVRRPPSPLAAGLSGPAAVKSESTMREAIEQRRAGVAFGPGQPLFAPLNLLRSRRSAAFSEYDGNVSRISEGGRLWTARAASPTSLESYAGCGFQYLCGYVLRLNVVEEPDDLEVMDATERGSLMHAVLERFFREKQAEGRPRPRESWGLDDLRRLLEIAVELVGRAHERGKTGLDIYADHDSQAIMADLAAFLEADNAFRLETGAVPSEFEVWIPEGEVAGVQMRGVVDRIDRSPDGTRAWVIDYKTGSPTRFKGISALDPLLGGTKLQLPAYVGAAPDADEVQALYWFISRKGGFERIEYPHTPQNQDRFRDTVAAILYGIRAGVFPAVSGDEDEFYGTWANCGYCAYDRICSRSRDQDFARIADAAEVAPWRLVGEVAKELRP